MPRLTAAGFKPEVLPLFDQYVHGGISRRGLLDDTTPRYDATAAPSAWQRTLAFFGKHLRG